MFRLESLENHIQFNELITFINNWITKTNNFNYHTGDKFLQLYQEDKPAYIKNILFYLSTSNGENINTNFIFLYLDNADINECTVLPNFKSPHNPIVKLSNLPFSHDIVNKSVNVCVGWLCPPSPAFIIGTSAFIAATTGAPSFG